MRQSNPHPDRIGEYTITEEIGRGAMSVVYAGVRDNCTYAVKIASAKSTNEQATLQFRREVAAAARLNDKGLVKVVEVGELNDQSYVVMDLAEGQSLDKALKNGPLTEEQVLAVAKTIGRALIEVHRFGLVHRDVKPANIMMSAGGEVKLIDFGFVAGATEERSSEQDAVVGTLHYAAPEQIGVLKRAVDGRADLYALGATLYECLTNRTPFPATNLNDLLAKLATQSCPPVTELRPGTRPVLSMIIAKLLAKDPDDRYQSARGLVADLEALTQIEEHHNKMQTWVLGERDTESVRQEMPLVGRQTELTALQKTWRETVAAKGSVVQIEGESGSGKTRLVRELLHEVRRSSGVVLMGKCQELDTIPFGPLREALEDLASRIQRQKGAERDASVKKLRDAAGDGAALVKRLSRGVAALLGDVPELAPLEPDAEKKRFYDSVSEMLCGISTQFGPTTIVVDDVQWIDDSSMEVVTRLAKRANSLKLLVLSTARSDPQHEAERQRYIDTLGATLAERIILKPLDINSVDELVKAHLGGKPLNSAVIERLANLTRGNPFAIGEYVRALLDHGHLRPFAGGWMLGADALSEVSLPSDILQLVVNRLSLLSTETARLVSIAGATGGAFSPELLASASGMTLEQVARCLEECERASLLERGAHGTYVFVHDRVAEAAIERVSEKDLRNAHQALAKALDNPHDASAHMYALARHYAEGHAEQNATRVCETNMTAGLHAVENSAFERGYKMLQLAIQYGEKAGIYKDHAMVLEEGLGRACAMTGRHHEAYEHLRKALGFATHKNDQFRLQFLLTLTNGSQGNVALEGLWQAFETLGQPYPKSTFGQLITMQLHWIGGILLNMTGWRRGAAKGEEREMRKALSQLHALGVMLALANADAVLMMQFVMRDFWNVHFLGATEEAAVTYSLYGAVLALFGLKKSSTYYGRLGMSIADQIGNQGIRALASFYNAFLTEWKGDADKGSNEMYAAGDALRKYLPGSAGTCTCLAANSYTKLYLGHSRSGIERLTSVRKDLVDTNHLLYQHNALIVLWAQLMVSGRKTEALEVRAHCDQLYRSVAAPPRYLKLGNCIVYLHVLLDDDAPDEEIETQVKNYNDLKILTDYYAVFALIDIAWFRLRQLSRATDAKQKKKYRRMFWAAFANVFARGVLMPQYRCIMYAMRATVARLDGNYKKALSLIEAGEKDARAVNSKLGQFYLSHEHARVAREMGNLMEARAHATVAMEIALSEGWKNRIGRLGHEFDLDAKRFGTTSLSGSRSGSMTLSRSGSGSSSSLGGLTSQRYADAILRVSLASSSSLDVNVQAKAALREVAGLLGGERAMLFLTKEGDSTQLIPTAFHGVEAAEEKELHTYSSTVVKKVADTRKPVVLASTAEGEAIGAKSVVAYGLRSVMAAPLSLRDNLVGVIYLDNRLAKGVFTEDDVDILLSIGNHIAIAFETARAAAVEAQKLALEKDLALTAAVQTMFLPRTSAMVHDGVKISGLYRSAAQCSGDWWWAGRTPNGDVRLLLGDVTGHGAAPAMLTASCAGAFKVLTRRAPDAPFDALLTELSKDLEELTSEYAMASLGLEIVPKSRELRTWSAGTPAPVVMKADGSLTLITCPGTPLGRAPLELGHKVVTLSPGDRVFAFTDGLTELEIAGGRQLGIRTLKNIFAATRSMNSDEAARHVGREVEKLRGDVPQADDITLVVIDVP